MALIHDLAEGLVGDIVVDRGGKTVGSPLDKHQKETAAIRKIFRGLPQEKEFISLWEECELQQSPTAKALKELDKFEMALQALEYEAEIQPEKLNEFWDSARKCIQSPRIKKLFNKIEGKHGKIRK